MTTGELKFTTPHMRVSKFCELTGWSDKAVRRKIEDGVWLEGKEYFRAPDGTVSIHIEGYNRWVEGQREAA